MSKEELDRGIRMKCEICGKEILRDSQCINYKYYHNDCIENLQQENQKYKEVIDKVIEKINKYENIKAYYEYIDEDGYDEYNYDEDFKRELLDILKEVSE